MSVYVAADTSFFSQEAAQENNQTIEEYNEMVINNWNSIIGNDDWVLLLGTISNGSKEDNIKLFNNLNGKKKYITYDKKSEISIDEYKEYGFTTVDNVPGFTKGKIDNQDSTVIIGGTSIYLFLKKNYRKEFNEYYFAIPGGLKSKEIYTNKVLNISIKNWGYQPIAYKDIPNIIDNMILFKSMKNEEENLNEKR